MDRKDIIDHIEKYGNYSISLLYAYRNNKQEFLTGARRKLKKNGFSIKDIDIEIAKFKLKIDLLSLTDYEKEILNIKLSNEQLEVLQREIVIARSMAFHQLYSKPTSTVKGGLSDIVNDINN